MNVWLFSGYGDNGGAHMNYQIGVVCQDVFGLTVYDVLLTDNESHLNNCGHEKRFISCSMQAFYSQVSETDLLIANPSHSKYLLGLRCKCKKIMYVQGFSTYSLLDVHFDTYVSVSKFVADYINSVYKIKSKVINAFIVQRESPLSFDDKEVSLMVYRKIDDYLFQSGAEMAREICSKLDIAFHIFSMGASADEIHKSLNAYKYFLTLSGAEGFGLVPLEAMSYGAVVFGLDGYGGKEYMKNGINCYVQDWKDYEKLGGVLFEKLKNPERMKRISQKAITTAQKYNKDVFNEKWIKVLAKHIY